MCRMEAAMATGIILLHTITAPNWAGSLLTWGHDGFGQVTNTPEGNEFTAVSAGDIHSVALSSDGRLIAWGIDNEGVYDYGQVRDTPTGSEFVAVSAGNYHNLALKSDGGLVAWGYDGDGRVSNTPAGKDFVRISAGGYGSLALKSDGTLVAWGSDNYGLVSDTPQDSNYVAVAAGDVHNLALKADGSIVAWGADGVIENTPTGNNFTAVTAGWNHSVALTSDGSLVAWGYDQYGQVSNTPAGNDFVAVSAGFWHSVALRSDGSLVVWGGDDRDQVSDAPTGNDFTAVAAGDFHSVAIAVLTDGIPAFTSDSADFSAVPFLHAQPGEVRAYQGQGTYVGTGFDRIFAEETFLGVKCLRIEETAVPAHDKESLRLWLAKDTHSQIWLFKVLLDDDKLFEASSLRELISCIRGAVPMELRLMTGNWGAWTRITDLAGSTTEVISTTATLSQFPGEQFVLVKWISESGLDVDYQYHHESRGLILDVWDHNGDVDGDGWMLTDFQTVRLHDWNGDGLVSIIGDVPPFVDCVYFDSCPDGMDPVAIGDCNGDAIVSIVGDVPCFVDCVYFDNCP